MDSLIISTLFFINPVTYVINWIWCHYYKLSTCFCDSADFLENDIKIGKKHCNMIDFLDFLAMEAIEDAHEEHEREQRHEDGEYDDLDDEDDE